MAAKASAIAMKALAIVGNMFATWAVSKAIEWVVKGIDTLKNSAKYCQERVDDLMSSFDSALDSANSNAKTVEGLISRYEELSKGVNGLGRNISLTTDEYDEYNSIVSQIADMFPTLVTGFTSEGVAILSLRDKVNELRDAYGEAQQGAYDLLITSGKDLDGNDIIKNFNNTVHGYTNWINEKNGIYINKDSGARQVIDIITQLSSASNADQLKNIEKELRKKYDFWDSKNNAALMQSGFQDLLSKPTSEITEKDLLNIKTSANAVIRIYQSEIDSALRNVQTLANAYLMGDEDFAKLDENSRTAASLIVNSITEDIASKFENSNAVGTYVANIVDMIAENPAVQFAIEGLFSLKISEMPVDDAKYLVDQYIKKIAALLQRDENEVKIMLGFEDVDALAGRFQETIRKGAVKLSPLPSNYQNNPNADLYYRGSEEQLRDFAEKNSINTEEERILLEQIIEESNTIEEVIKRYLAEKKEDSLSFKIPEDYSTKLADIESAYSTAKNAMDEYNTTGMYSMSTIDSLIGLENSYMSVLMNANGEIEVSEEGLNRLAAIKIENAKASLYQQAHEEMVRIKALDTASAVNELALANGNLTESAYESAKALYLKMQTMEPEKAALADAVWSATEAKVKLLDKQLVNLQNGSYSVKKTVASDTKETTDDIKKYIDSHMDFMDKSLSTSKIDYQSYSKEVSSYLSDIYKDGKISAEDYHSHTQKMLERQKQSYDSAISAVIRRLEKEIDSYEDQIDTIEKRYQQEIDSLDEVISYHEKQKEILQDESDEVDRRLALEQSLYDLQRAQGQKTKKVLTVGQGFVYTADEDAIRSAQDNVKKAKLDIEVAKIDEAIKKVKEQQDSLKEAMDKETEQLQTIINNLNEYKDKWAEISDEYKHHQEDMMAAQLFGSDWEKKILDGSLVTLENFKNEYISKQQEIEAAAWKSANARILAEQEAEKGSKGTLGGSTPIENNDEDKNSDKKKFSVVDARTGTTIVKGFNTSASAKKWIHYADDAIYPEGSLKVATYHTGLHQGFVGANGDNKALDLIKKYSLNDGEFPAILKKRELVFTEGQWQNLANNLKLNTIMNPILQNLSVPNYSKMGYGNNSQSFNINIGDIKLEGVQNASSFADAIVRELPNKMLQAIHRRY